MLLDFFSVNSVSPPQEDFVKNFSRPFYKMPLTPSGQNLTLIRVLENTFYEAAEPGQTRLR